MDSRKTWFFVWTLVSLRIIYDDEFSAYNTYLERIHIFMYRLGIVGDDK